MKIDRHLGVMPAVRYLARTERKGSAIRIDGGGFRYFFADDSRRKDYKEKSFRAIHTPFSDYGTTDDRTDVFVGAIFPSDQIS